jgi:branched-chain amino acid transport system substrate-binding protein
VMISAITDSGAVAVTRQVDAAIPGVKIFGTAGLAESSYTDPSQGGIPNWLDARVLLTGAPPGSRGFYAAYGRSYGDPEPDAVYGYEAMNLLLSAISRASDGGRELVRRSRVLEEIFRTRERRSVLGTYSITPSGDTTIRHFGVYRIVDGRLWFWKNLEG